jgi:hypothetical protein
VSSIVTATAAILAFFSSRENRKKSMCSNQQLANMHFMYGLADDTAAVARRLYQERYPGRRCTHRKTFVSNHFSLCEHGNFALRGANRGQPRSTTTEVEEDILDL